MAGRVIQGFFIGSAMAQRPGTIQRATPSRPAPGPPALAFAPLRPPSIHQTAPVAQRFGGDGRFEVDPATLGLARGGGNPLPRALLAKMEAAFGADFSAVRVHIGPQAARIGAVAFATGNDLYFAPGQFQPHTAKGQQLLGHELAHVVQQRQGRVRAPGSGMAVVQDRMLEAEADRLGMRAAMHNGPPAAPVQMRPLGHRAPLQRAQEGKEKEKADLVAIAKAIHAKLTDNARAQSASTVAIVEYSNGTLKCATNDVQKPSEIALQTAKGLGIVDGINPSGVGFHAEMWIVLNEMHALNKVSRIGASRACCKYCTAILKECGITAVEPSATLYQSWVNPLTTNEESNPRADFASKQKKAVPDWRQKNKDYWWTDTKGKWTNDPQGS